MTRKAIPGAALALAAALAALPGAAGAQMNDYPTAARAEYVFACMAANGQNRAILEKCSCSIDVIASIIPYERYVEAETVLTMRQVGGEKTSIFRSAAMMKEMVADLRRAEAEAEIRCF